MSYRPPTLGRKEVDLYRLFREVTAYGGCDSVVSKEGTWAKIYRGSTTSRRRRPAPPSA